MQSESDFCRKIGWIAEQRLIVREQPSAAQAAVLRASLDILHDAVLALHAIKGALNKANALDIAVMAQMVFGIVKPTERVKRFYENYMQSTRAFRIPEDDAQRAATQLTFRNLLDIIATIDDF